MSVPAGVNLERAAIPGGRGDLLPRLAFPHHELEAAHAVGQGHRHGALGVGV